VATRERITEATIEAARKALEKRIATPPPPKPKDYSKKEAFLELKAKVKEALATGHTIESVINDLKGVGIPVSITTARQYLKPGRKRVKKAATQQQTETTQK
jgi:hypothetical protein